MKQIIMGMVTTAFLLCATISSAATFSAAYTSSPQADGSVILNVTVTNVSADSVYGAKLKPVGMLASVAAVNLGNLPSGGTATFQLSSVRDPGYLVFSGRAQDALGNPVSFDVVGAGQ